MRTRADVLADLAVTKNEKVNSCAGSIVKTAEIRQLESELQQLENDEQSIQRIAAIQTLQLDGYEITVTVKRIQQ